MPRKSFFKERDTSQIRQLDTRRVYTLRNLTRRIEDLDPSEDALELRTVITPGEFRRNTQNSAEASRKCYKHGSLTALSQPLTQQDAYACPEIPLAMRERDFNDLRKLKEQDVNFVGHSFYPVQGRDRRKRVVPFVWLLEGARLFAYSENLAREIEVASYDDSRKVKKEGADIVCRVPSRTKKKPRYRVKLMHVPVDGGIERRAIALGLKSEFEISPEHKTYNIRYAWEHDREGSERFTFYPQDIAAYIAVVRDYWKQKNMTPLEMNPLALPSAREAELYSKMCNNVLIYDPSLSSKHKLRKLHLDEKSILLARSIAVLGHDETMFWDPGRDGKLRNYNWQI